MSIIHDALKQHDKEISGVKDEIKNEEISITEIPAWLPAALGVGGIFLAALLTYLLTKPGEVTVIVAKDNKTVPVNQHAVNSSIPTNNVDVNLDPISGPYLSPYISPTQTQQNNSSVNIGPQLQSPQSEINNQPLISQQTQIVQSQIELQSKNAYAENQPFIQDFRDIPVYHGTELTNPDDVPPDALTIEMSEGQISSVSGSSFINGSSAAPGNGIKVGSIINTAADGNATLSFNKADVDLGNNSSAKITRLERVTKPNGGVSEEVTVYLSNGNANAIVRPGEGSILLSTKTVTASSSSGAFQISSDAEGNVKVKSNGGQVKLVENSNPNSSVIVSANETVVFRNGKFEKINE